MRTIYEYEFKFKLGNSIIRAQQSGYSSGDAKKRIKGRYPQAREFKMTKKMKYPHREGGLKIRW